MVVLVSLLCLLAFLVSTSAYAPPCVKIFSLGDRLHSRMSVSRMVNSDKERMKEEQFRIQQEMLARRKDKGKMKQYFERVEKNRENVSKESKKTIWAKSNDKEDPLTKWKVAMKDGKIKKLGYEPEPGREQSITGLNVIIPLNPIGVPKFDEGERFDLRLPYAERGYEDPDADVMGKFMKGVSSLFSGKGNGKKNNEKGESNDKITKKNQR